MHTYFEPDLTRKELFCSFRLEKEKSYLRAVRQGLLNIDADDHISANADFLQSITLHKLIYLTDRRGTDSNFLFLLKNALGLLELFVLTIASQGMI